VGISQQAEYLFSYSIGHCATELLKKIIIIKQPQQLIYQIICTLQKILLDYNERIKEYEMGVAFTRMGEQEKHTKFWSEILKRRDHLGDIGVDGNIEMDNGGTGCDDVNWIRQSQYRDRWRALVKTVRNLRVP
jgi:hypothetical protein